MKRPALPTPLSLDNPLWTFACAAWRLPDVETLALDLQTRGMPVDLWLVCAWCGLNDLDWDGQTPPALADWREHGVASLRRQRQQIPRTDPVWAPLRDRLLATELCAEQYLFAAWHQTLASSAQGARQDIRLLGERVLRHLNHPARTPDTDAAFLRALERLMAVLASARPL
ncbi:MAG: DUF2390 domain-containing protein [Gammaproteobacteria bacterium]|nr:DUF2390 domain-containing protein [Gammaproteobacteria bacterium]